ncbi:MAG: hypothetical protein EOP49_19700 [Sphingobacteriales bacterium]|nr:MAG: hypothetical protein EOP49_19700 [Sphingobacteriales bacterium]
MVAVYRTGFIAAIFALLGIAGYGIVQIMQVLRLLVFPLDEWLIYGFSLWIALPFLFMVVALRRTLTSHGKLWSEMAVSLATIYLMFALTVYGVQLTVVLPAGKTISQYDWLRITPHSFFWTLDALAYLSMGLTTLFLVPALRQIKKSKWARFMLLAHGLMTIVVMVVYFYPHFSTAILLIASPWLITGCGVCVTLAAYFKEAGRTHNY